MNTTSEQPASATPAPTTVYHVLEEGETHVPSLWNRVFRNREDAVSAVYQEIASSWNHVDGDNWIDWRGPIAVEQETIQGDDWSAVVIRESNWVVTWTVESAQLV